MAAAARPGPAEARIPCPLCGGLIHPIAGRCKHCKGELGELRTARAAAAAALPPLAIAPALAARPAPGAPARAHVAPPAIADAKAHAVVALPVEILPPRPTARQPARPASTTAWRSWPIVVIAIAVIAILAAVALMVWPPGGGSDDRGAASSNRLGAPPAPDRMETDIAPTAPTPAPSQPDPAPTPAPDPGARGADPWQPGPRQPDPGTPADPALPTPTPIDPDDDPSDPNASGRSSFSGLGTSPFLFSVLRRACTRVTQCGGVDPAIGLMCQSARSWPTLPTPSCPAAQRCLARIDDLSCDSKLDSSTALLELMTRFDDCADAMSC